jgi:Domain of unknown function (DUF4340)
MTMNFKTTLLLLLALVIVGGFAWVSTLRESAPAAPEKKLWLTVQAADVVELELLRDENVVATASRRDGAWRLLKPTPASADVAQVESFLNAVLNVMDVRSIKENDPAALGLKPAAMSVVVQTSTGRHRIRLGNRSGSGGRAYAQIDTGPALSVEESLLETVENAADQLRDRRLVVDAGDVRQIQIIGAQTTELSKVGEGWQIVGPDALKADGETVEGVIRSLSGLRADEFIADADTARLGFQSPALIVRWSSASTPTGEGNPSTTAPATRELLVGRFDDVRQRNVFVSVDGVAARVPASEVAPLRLSTLALRDRTAMTLTPSDVESIRITTDFQATTRPTTRPASTAVQAIFRRALPTTTPATSPATEAPKSAWVVGGVAEVDADDAAVDRLLAAFAPLRATSLSTIVNGTIDRTYRCVFTMKAGTSVEATILLTSDGRAMTSIGGIVYELPTTIATALGGPFAAE